MAPTVISYELTARVLGIEVLKTMIGETEKINYLAIVEQAITNRASIRMLNYEWPPLDGSGAPPGAETAAGHLVGCLLSVPRAAAWVNPPWKTNRLITALLVIECFFGFDPFRKPGEGYEPSVQPAGLSEDPAAFTEAAIDHAIDLVCHPAGIERVASRIAADILFGTKGRDKWAKAGKSKFFPVETEIARARRILDVFAIEPPEDAEENK